MRLLVFTFFMGGMYLAMSGAAEGLWRAIALGSMLMGGAIGYLMGHLDLEKGKRRVE